MKYGSFNLNIIMTLNKKYVCQQLFIGRNSQSLTTWYLVISMCMFVYAPPTARPLPLNAL